MQHDIDYYNEVNRENRQYTEWEKHEKNRIMRMTNTKKKQVEWSKLFTPKTAPDDSYLAGGVY